MVIFGSCPSPSTSPRDAPPGLAPASTSRPCEEHPLRKSRFSTLTPCPHHSCRNATGGGAIFPLQHAARRAASTTIGRAGSRRCGGGGCAGCMAARAGRRAGRGMAASGTGYGRSRCGASGRRSGPGSNTPIWRRSGSGRCSTTPTPCARCARPSASRRARGWKDCRRWSCLSRPSCGRGQGALPRAGSGRLVLRPDRDVR
jgi:hypothetical protein